MKQPFQDMQHSLTAYLRDPQANPPPAGIEPRRLAVYRDLFYNNIESFLSQGFPVIQELLKDKLLWHDLVREFFARHPCESPYFVDIPGQFVSYVATLDLAHSPYPAYLAELAHYEWLEMVLDVSTDNCDMASVDASGDLLEGRPVLNPVHRITHYHWPVTTIAPGREPDTPLPTPMHILLFRDASERIRFMEINVPTRMLLEQLAKNPDLTGARHLQVLAQQLVDINPAQLFSFGRDLLMDFRQRGLILGTSTISV